MVDSRPEGRFFHKWRKRLARSMGNHLMIMMARTNEVSQDMAQQVNNVSLGAA
jgi:uncharacterized protein (DUF1919 family)